MKRLSLVVMGAAAALAWSHDPASAQVGGSFVGSCVRVQVRGPFVRALCEDVRGNLIPARADIRACPGRRLANRNGRLVCEQSRRQRFFEERSFDDDAF